MAAPISHLVYANEYLKAAAPRKSKEDFLVGVCFPDIRYISSLTRQETHQSFRPLDLNFEELSDFEAGMKFHCWCDMRRGELLLKYRFQEIEEVKNSPYLSAYFLEDLLVWKTYQNWETLCNILTNAQYQSFSNKLSETDWKFWYQLVGDYIKQEPTEERIRAFCKPVPKVALKIDGILESKEKIAQNESVVGILSNVYKEILG